MINAIPAHGRDYKSIEAVIEDWEADRDFLIQDVSSPHNGGYINKEQAADGNIAVKIRYDSLRQFLIIPKKIT